MAAVSETPTLFLRKATGLVKGWSKFDAFVYSFLSVNLVCLGLYFSLSVLPFVPDGQILPSVILTGVFVSFLVITYACLIAVMPRAGGDYVWQSRIFNGGAAFLLAVTGWWFTLWHWAPIYGNVLAVQFFQPFWATLKLKIGSVDAQWFASKNGIFFVSMVAILMASFFVSLGMQGYARVQKFCWYGGMIGLAIMCLVLLFGSRSGFQSAFNQEAAHLFGAHGNAYQQTIQASVKAGYTPKGLSFSPFFGASLLLIPFLLFYLLWPNWGATLYGEVRGASDFKRVASGMMYGLWVTIALTIVFVLLASKTFGWSFFLASNNNFWSGNAQPMPIWPYPPMLAGFFLHNTLFSAVFILLMGMWFVGWAGTLFLSSSRVIFAAAFDRVLPEWAGSVSEKRHVPYGALALMFFPAIIISIFYAYTGSFAKYTLDATLVIAVAFFGSSLAAAVLPWRKKQMYQNSPVARYTVLGIPLITVAGGITAAFIGWNLFQWIKNDVYAINNTQSLFYMGGLYTLAAVVYLVAKYSRKRQGVDLTAIHAEIPVD